MKSIRALMFLCMTMFGFMRLAAQVPTAQPQPNAPAYGTNVLSVLPTYSRASYLSAFGKQAPAFDASRPPKAWFDSTKDCSNMSTMSTYSVLKLSGNIASEGTLVIPNCDASRINLPGGLNYPAYTVAASGVLEEPGDTPVNPNYLSTLDQANGMLKQFGDASLQVTQQQMAFFSYVFPTNEPRRFYMVGHPNGFQENVGLLLVDQNFKGVGYPGHWQVGADGSHSWVNEALPPDGTNDPRPFVAPPVRPLLPNEKFASTLMSAQIVRTDMSPAPAPASTGFTDADRAILNRILQLLDPPIPSARKNISRKP